MRLRMSACLAAVSTSVFSAVVLAQSSGAPTLIVVNGRVFTGVRDTPWAEAFSIAGERIGVVGTSSEVRKLAGPKTRVFDAEGRVVIPGINDAHVHIGTWPTGVALEGPPAMEQDPPLEQILTRLKAAVVKAPKGGWIYGQIGAVVLDDPKATRSAIDAAAPDHAVVLTAWTGHGSLLNTAALRRLNIREDEPDPPGGFFARSQGNRTITGVAHEYAQYLVSERLVKLAGDEAQVVALRAYAKEALGFGITSVQDMGDEAFVKSALSASVPLRVRVMDFHAAGMASWREPLSKRVKGADRLTVSGTKWILDGTPVERLMFLREPYADRPATRGALNFPPDQIASALKLALAQREQPLFHAVGDAAIDAALAALEGSGGSGWQPLRPRIEHGDMVEPSHFDRIRKVGAVVVQNPSHFMLPQIMNVRLGARSERMTMMKSMAGAGVPVALGSDGPMNPYLNLMFATINANNPAEAMTREQAIAAYTLGSAHAEFQESRKGTISPGMLADVAVLSQDIFTVPAEVLPKTSSLLTVVGGQVVHETLSAGRRAAPPSKRMADGKEWTTANLDIATGGSYCYGDEEANCRRYGRLYIWEAARQVCALLGEEWRLPTNEEWRRLGAHYGGIRQESADLGKAAFTALMTGGQSGFNAVLGGGRNDKDEQYARIDAHGFYWTSTESTPTTAWMYNFGVNAQSFGHHEAGEKLRAFAVRCVRD